MKPCFALLSGLTLSLLSSCSYFSSQSEAPLPEAGNATEALGVANLPAETGVYQPTGAGGATPTYDNSDPYYGDQAQEAPYRDSGNSSPATKGGSETAAKHVVVARDTLWGISKKYKVSVEAIKSANQLKSDTIVVGQTLVIPSR